MREVAARENGGRVMAEGREGDINKGRGREEGGGGVEKDIHLSICLEAYVIPLFPFQGLESIF